MCVREREMALGPLNSQRLLESTSNLYDRVNEYYARNTTQTDLIWDSNLVWFFNRFWSPMVMIMISILNKFWLEYLQCNNDFEFQSQLKTEKENDNEALKFGWIPSKFRVDKLQSECGKTLIDLPPWTFVATFAAIYHWQKVQSGNSNVLHRSLWSFSTLNFESRNAFWVRNSL